MSTAFRAVDTRRTRVTFCGDRVACVVDVPGFAHGESYSYDTVSLLAQQGVPVGHGEYPIERVLGALRDGGPHWVFRQLRTYLLNAKIKGATHVRVG